MADIETLPHHFVQVLVCVEDKGDRPVCFDEPAQPTGVHRPQRVRRGARHMAVGEVGCRADIDERAAVGHEPFDSGGREPGQLRAGVVTAGAEPVQFRETREIRREGAELGEQPFHEPVLIGDAEHAFVVRSRRKVVVRCDDPDAEQNDPAPWVG